MQCTSSCQKQQNDELDTMLGTYNLQPMGMGYGMVYMRVGHHKVVKLMTGGEAAGGGAGLGHRGKLPPAPTWIRPCFLVEVCWT